jgi:hypothetical protein
MPDTPAFTGFASPNTTPVPDQLFDELLAVLSGNELKVLLYIVRRTFGFKKQSDNISLSQMLHGIRRKDGSVLDGGVGLSKPTLLNALHSLVAQGIIQRQRRASKTKGNLPTCYSLRFADAPARVSVSPIPTPLGQTSLPGGGQKALPTTRNRKTSIQNNVEKKPDGTANSPPAKPREQVDYLVDEIERHTGDTHSRGGFAQLARLLPDQRVFELLAEMRQDPGIRNKGAWFNARARQLTKGPPP